jgi:mannose-6-phosphate isomerase-like protein (cupin superfamily)
MTAAAADFARDGFVGPVPLLTLDECRSIVTRLGSEPEPLSFDTWSKGRFPEWLLSDIAAKRALLDLLLPILGDDIILWGASLVRRGPEVLHPWHVDIEAAAPDGRFVTAWIGLENTGQESAIRVIAGSHRGKSVQQMRAEKGTPREEHSNDMVLGWAREENPDARIVQPEMSDGDALLFDGRMWHGSFNATKKMRTALLLQFAAAECPVRIPVGLDWPFRFLDSPMPPVVAVHGNADSGVNRVIPAAPAPVVPALPSSIRVLNLPLAEDASVGWKRYPLFRGSTAALDSMSCHAAVLSAGYSPHQPHAHADEELLIILAGEANLLTAEGDSYERARAFRVKAGDFSYYPPGQHHTIRNPANSPVTYMMFRWRSAAETPTANRLRPTLFRAPPPVDAQPGRGFAVRSVFSSPTRWLRKLHCHMSRLEPGAGYAPHIDPYDVAILIQSGRVRTLGRDVGPGTLVYCSAGELHGMRNIGNEPAHYIVFEFHGRPLQPPKAKPDANPAAAQIATSPAA